MLEPAFPADEAHRLDVLRALQILDTPPEERFDRITRVAQRLFDVPIALVSLVDADRQWFKSCLGLSASETPRSISFCGHAILGSDTFVVANALEDPRFADNPLVTDAPYIRFYAGHPLKAADGSMLGTLCIIDYKPRDFTADTLALLADLAGCVERELNQQTLVEAIANVEASRLELHQSQQQLQHVLSCSPSVIYTLVFEQGRPRATWISTNIERFLGFDVAETLAQPNWWIEHVHPEDREAAGAAIASLMERGHIVHSYRMLNQTGQYIWVRDELQLLEKDGDTHQAIGSWSDITESKKVELLKSEFVSTVSHELRTPLTSIRGSLGLVAGGVTGELTPQAKSLIDIAYKNSERLVGLINDLLDVEKIESGKMKFDLKPSRLMDMVDQSVQANQGYAQQYDVRFEVVQRIPETIKVVADEMRLIQVLSNLLSNAAKFSPKGGMVEISVAQNDGRIRVGVRDRGPGIPQAFRSRIFQKFSQADSSDTRQKGGTGLGLSITKAIIEHMHGTIGFETKEGEGATFWFELAEWNGESANPVLTNTAMQQAIPRVLVCEDDPDVATLLALMLQKAGYEPDVVHDAENAKKMLASHRYDALTLDLNLPGQSGAALIRELRADPATADLPIVVVSGKTEQGKAEISGGFSVADWLGKPIEQLHLLEALHSTIHRLGAYRAKILHVEDDPDLRQVVAVLSQEIADCDSAATVAEAADKLATQRYDLVILDLGMPDQSGWHVLEYLRQCRPQPPVLMFSGQKLTKEESARVNAVLVKSQTSNAELLETIRSLMKNKGGKSR